LRFTCEPECGACCTQHEDYAYVYLVGDDVERLARHLGISQVEFRERYTILDDGNLALKIDRPECPFLEGWRCGVYEARPRQCRTFPFWPETLRSRSSWERLRGFCPGISRGERHSLEVIQRHLAEHEAD
jgi:Fe-S-cluster containining protein